MIYSNELRSETNPKDIEQEIYIQAAAIAGMNVAHSTHIDMTTNSFDFGGKFRLPDWKVATVLLQKLTGGAGYQLDVLVTSGYLKVTLNALTFTTATAPTFTNGTRHKVKAKVSVGTTQTTVSIWVDGVLFETMAAQNNTTSLANAAVLYILGTSAACYEGGVSQVTVDNYTITTELDRYRNGISFADKWGSQTELMPNQVDRDFSGASAWANVDLNAYNETTDLTITATVANQYCTCPVASAPTTVNKKYRMSFDVATIVSTWTIKSFDGTQTIGQVTANGTGQKLEWTASTTGGYRIVSDSTTSSGDFDNFSLVEIGVTLALEPEGIQSDKWYDSSTNGLDASYPASGSSLTRLDRVIQEGPLGTPASGTLTNCTGYPGLAITAGKTITATENTSLDEAVAMSSKAPKASPSFTGNVLGVTASAHMGVQNPTNTGVIHVGGIDGVSLTDNQTFTITLASQGAVVILNDLGVGKAGVFFITYSSATIVELADPSVFFEVTDSDLNPGWAIYKSANSMVVTIKNYTNATRSINVIVLGVIESANTPVP